MYNRLQNLSTENIQNLLNVASQVNFIDTNKRMGANGVENPSIYTYSKWKTWSHSHRQLYKSMFNADDIDKALIGWYLKFSADTGFLDLMTTWVTGRHCGSVIAYSLNNNQNLWLQGQELVLQQGEGIKFKLNVPHEVKQSSQEQLWACIMQVE